MKEQKPDKNTAPELGLVEMNQEHILDFLHLDF